jgi:hypothetical protein
MISELEDLFKSQNFSSAFLRILYHVTHDSETIQNCAEKLRKLSEFRISKTPKIISKFLDRRTGNDVTLDPHGSFCLVDEDNECLWVAMDLPPCMDIKQLLCR